MLALAVIAVGLVLYVSAFLINTPTKSCVALFSSSSSSSSSSAGSGVTVATAASARTEWVGIVASRCEWTFVAGPDVGAAFSGRVIEWGPSALAIVGLIAAATGVWMWLRLRDKAAQAREDARSDHE